MGPPPVTNGSIARPSLTLQETLRSGHRHEARLQRSKVLSWERRELPTQGQNSASTRIVEALRRSLHHGVRILISLSTSVT